MENPVSIHEKSASKTLPLDPDHVDWNELHIPRFITISSLLSLAENAVFYPFYLIKTREQVDRSLLKETIVKTSSLSQTNLAARFRSAVHLTQSQFRDALHPHGIRGLYKGFWSSSLGHMPPYAIYLMLYSYCKHQLGWSPDTQSNGWWRNFYIPLVSGVVADLGALSLYVPVDVVVQRMQLKDNPYKNAWHATRSIVREEGIRGLYRGGGAALTYSVVGSAVWWTVYENTKAVMMRQSAWFNRSPLSHRALANADSALSAEPIGEEKKPHRMVHFGAGLVTGVVTATIINPLDIVTTRLQTQHHLVSASNPAASAKNPQASKEILYRNFVHGLRQMVREEGFRAFTKGLLPNIAYKAPLSAFSSVLYELTFYYSRKETK